jgi:putative membrane protein
MKAPFTESELASISEAIQTQEAKTTGQIALCEVEASDAYPFTYLAAGIAAMALATATAFGLHEFRHATLHLYELILLQAAAFAAGALLCARVRAVRRFLIPPTVADTETRQQALTVFHSHRLGDTRDRNAVLIFVSLLEQRIVILADRGIVEKAPEGTWVAIRDRLAAGFRAGRSVEALRDAAGEIGTLLAQHFPGSTDTGSDKPNVLRG